MTTAAEGGYLGSVEASGVGIQVEVDEGTGTVHVSGVLDVFGMTALIEGLRQAEDSGVDEVVVDLGGVVEADGLGVEVLVSEARRLARQDKALRVVRVSEAVMRLLRGSGLVG